MRNYKVEFSEKERNIFNTLIESDLVRTKMMSLYSTFVKYTDNNKCTLTISFKKFHNIYKRHHIDIGLTYFKKLINKLEEIGLINIDKTAKTNTYTVNRIVDTVEVVTEIVSEIVTDEKVAESLETTSLEGDSELPKYKILNIDKDIDIYSNFDYPEYINSNEKCTSLVDVRIKAKELLEQMRVKNNWIKDYVLIVVSKFYKNITIKFLENYIIKLISTARTKYYKNYNNARAKKYIKPLKCANFTQRTYDYNNLEKELLAHYQGKIVV